MHLAAVAHVHGALEPHAGRLEAGRGELPGDPLLESCEHVPGRRGVERLPQQVRRLVLVGDVRAGEAERAVNGSGVGDDDRATPRAAP